MLTKRFRKTVEAHIALLEGAHGEWEKRRAGMHRLSKILLNPATAKSREEAQALAAEVLHWEAPEIPSIRKSIELYNKALRIADEAEAEADAAYEVIAENAVRIAKLQSGVVDLQRRLAEATAGAAEGWMRIAKMATAPAPPAPPVAFADTPDLTLVVRPAEFGPPMQTWERAEFLEGFGTLCGRARVVCQVKDQQLLFDVRNFQRTGGYAGRILVVHEEGGKVTECSLEECVLSLNGRPPPAPPPPAVDPLKPIGGGGPWVPPSPSAPLAPPPPGPESRLHIAIASLLSELSGGNLPQASQYPAIDHLAKELVAVIEAAVPKTLTVGLWDGLVQSRTQLKLEKTP